MSVVILTHIYCDNCAKNYGVDNAIYNAGKHRRDAKKEGWTQRGSLDFCDECSSVNTPINNNQK